MIACVASVSVGLSARWRRFSLFGCAKIGASATLHALFCARPNFPAARKVESLTETLATQASLMRDPALAKSLTNAKPVSEKCFVRFGVLKTRERSHTS